MPESCPESFAPPASAGIARSSTLLASILLSTAILSGCTDECPAGPNSDSLYCHNASGTCTAGQEACASGCADLQSDSLNCGACGVECAADQVCSAGACVDGCTGGLALCGTSCVDLDTSADHCGSCDSACPTGGMCVSGGCACGTGAIECGGACVDPDTDETYCGATGTCTGTDSGTTCDTGEMCVDGTCVASVTYVGSLPKSKGRWEYMGTVGIDGANALCVDKFGAGTAICTYAQLTTAQTAGELTGATDFNGVAVSSWWVDDPAAADNRRCVNTIAENIPWSYPTGHIGVGGKYVDLNNAAGTISALTEAIACTDTRAVACCNQ